jgi:hypothetical protein
MPHDTYRGLPANITVPPTTVAIASSTNASPIKITTSAPHLLASGDVVTIDYHLVNTAANGVWTVVVVDADEFTLTGSTGVGVGGATGTVQSLDMGTTDMVTDGNDPLAAEWTVPDACSLDRTAYLWLVTFLSLRRPLVALPNSDERITFYSDLYTMPDVSAARLYDLPAPTYASLLGKRLRFRVVRQASTNAADGVVRYNGTNLATFPGLAGASWADFDSTASNTYIVSAWGGGTTL